MLTEERVKQLVANTQQTLTDGATITWDFSLGNIAVVTLGGNRTLQITNANNLDVGILYVYQDGTGGRTLALSGIVPSTYALSAGATQMDELSFQRIFGNNVWDFRNYGSVPDPSISAPVLGTPLTTSDGAYIDLPYSKAMITPATKQAQYSYTIGGVAKTFSAAALKSGDNTVIRLTCSQNVINGDVVTVSYTPGDIFAVDGGIATSFSGTAVTNNVPLVATDIPNYADWNFIVDPRSTSNLVLSGSTVSSIKDSSGAARSTTGGGNAMLYDSANKFLNMYVAPASAQNYTFGSTVSLPSADWTIAFVAKFPVMTGCTITSSVAGGNFMWMSAGVAGSGVAHLGLYLKSSIIIPTSTSASLQRITSTTTKYRIIITKTGTTIKYFIQGVGYTAPSNSIGIDYFTRYPIATSAVGPYLYLHMQGNYVPDANIAALDTFLQTF